MQANLHSVPGKDSAIVETHDRCHTSHAAHFAVRHILWKGVLSFKLEAQHIHKPFQRASGQTTVLMSHHTELRMDCMPVTGVLKSAGT